MRKTYVENGKLVIWHDGATARFSRDFLEKKLAEHEKEVEKYREWLRLLTLPAPDKGDSPSPGNLSTLEGGSTAEHELTPAPCG